MNSWDIWRTIIAVSILGFGMLFIVLMGWIVQNGVLPDRGRDVIVHCETRSQ